MEERAVHATVAPAIAKSRRQMPLVVTVMLSLERTGEGPVTVVYPPTSLGQGEPEASAALPIWDDEPTWEDAEWC